jgi:AraC-like DNA-binding protein
MSSCKKSSDKKFFSLCNDCETKRESNIEFISYSAKKKLCKKSESSSLFFLLEGQIEVSYRKTTCLVENGYFYLIPANENYIVRLLGKVKLLIYHLDENLFVRHKRKESLLYDICNMKLPNVENCELFTSKINRYIQPLLDDCIAVINSGFLCSRYTQCKTEELLILMRNYYPDELLARLFQPAFGSKIDFHEVIKKNRDKFFTVEEYAAATNLDKNAFCRKFKDTYGVNPTEWIKQERIKRVFQELIEGNKPIANIVNDYKFSNFSNFIRFCNIHYKNTPGNIRKIINGAVEISQNNR